LAFPSLGEVEVHLHLGSVAVVGHPTNGHESVADRQQGEVGAREVHLGSRGGDTCGSVDGQGRVGVLKGLVGESTGDKQD